LEGAGHALAERFRMQADDRFWDPLPFFHMSTMLPMACCRASGATFIGVGHFEPGPAVQEIVTEQATVLFPSFPTLTNALFTHPDFSPEALHKVRLVNNVGPPDLLRRFAAQLPAAVHVTAYGLTEAGGVIAFNELDDTLEQRVETSGRPMLGSEVRIVDEQGAFVETGERGEIAVRGPQVMRGYWNAPHDTTAAFTPDGFLRTGDIGYMTAQGYVFLVDRKKDLIVVSGFNVYPNEVEGVVATHPGVLECAVVGVPDEQTGEAVKLFVVRRDPSLTADQLTDYCHEQLTGYKRPKHIEFRNELPKTNVGKILRRELRDEKVPA
jgi:long-chain acyl-CoA synthetase